MRSVCGIRRGIPLAYYILVRSHAHISIRNHATQVPIRGVLLRPYQESCLEACLNALDSGATRIGVSLPTGSGKTTVFLSLISRLRPSPKHSGADKALIIVNSIELARQSAEQAKKLHPELTVEIEQGIKYKASGTADVTIATYQTLLRSDRLSKFDPSRLKCVIVDEAHHAAAPSYRKILSHFDVNIRHPDVDFPQPKLSCPIPIIGFSATFSRHDGLALGAVFERIVYHRDFVEMIKEQWLCNIRFTSVKATLNLSNVTINSHTGEFNPTSLAHVINTDTVNRLIVQSWLDRASSRRSTLVFCVNLSHLRELTRIFREAGVDARYVYAGTPAQERKSLIEAFKDRTFPVLLNVAILTEGTDIPNIDCIVIARPTRSRNIFAQMIGRGMRLSPQTGKVDCHIIDFVDSTGRMPGVVSVPTLLGLHPDEVIEDEPLEAIEERLAEKTERKPMLVGLDADDIPEPTAVTYIDFDNPFNLFQDASGAPHVFKLSRFAWVSCGGDNYVLECLGKGYIKIGCVLDDENRSRYVGSYVSAAARVEMITPAWKRKPFLRPRQILAAERLEEAIRGCDMYALRKVVPGSMRLGLLRTAKWRRDPATESQKAIILKRQASRSTSTSQVVDFDVDSLTKGQAANIITRLKHGAQFHYNKKTKLLAKEERVKVRERERLARERVTVGSL